MSLFSLIAEILMVGHSLIGGPVAPMTEAGLIQRGDAEARVQAQIINGASLAYNWDHAAEAEGLDARAALLQGADALVLTEAQPLSDHAKDPASAEAVARWAALAWQGNPAAQVFILETWPARGPDWQARIAADRAGWQGLVAAAEARRPASAPPVRLIPAGRAMALADQSAQAGTLPGVDSIEALFSDEIHLSGKGQYLQTMVQLAALTGKSPEGLPAKLMRHWPSRDAEMGEDLARALQAIAWAAINGTEAAAAPLVAAAPQALTPITNPALAFGLAGVNDWTVQQPFLDVMKTARPWTGHLPGQWGGMEYPQLVAEGWIDADGWPFAIPPQVTGLSTLVLTDLPPDAGGVAGRYLLRWRGKGDLRVEGRAQNVTPEGGGLAFDFTPGEGAVILTLTAQDPTDPIRDVTLVRADRVAAHDAGAIFNPDWLARLRGAKAIRFMDWMATNDSALSNIEDSPKPDDATWARNGVPVEIMVALANELDADPWFTVPHLASDALVRFQAETVADLLEPGLVAHVEYSNEVWNPQFAQSRWAGEQAGKLWGDPGAGLQFYGYRAAQVADIWAATFGDQARTRLVRVIGTQTGVPGNEAQILEAPLAVKAGARSPVGSFDAYAVTGYFAALLGAEVKAPMIRGWLKDSAAADPAAPFALATRLAAEELSDGRHSGLKEDTLDDLLTRILPYQAEVARKHGLRLVMYEGGSHVVGYGPVMEDAELTGFFQQLNYAPEMGALYDRLLKGWSALTDAPFNAFVDVYRPGKWGSWGALRHLGDDNPRWQALAKGCHGC